MPTDPRIVATIGLHGSASTWVYNVVRELLIAAFGEAAVLSFYTDNVDELPAEADNAARIWVIKTHHGSAELDDWLGARSARTILSIRDPRDACLSMSQRFGAPLTHTVRWLAQDCNRIMRLAGSDTSLLRYEDRFFDDIVWTKRLAATLGLSVDMASISAIFQRYQTETVRQFAQSLMQLPPGRVSVGTLSSHDQVTQIHNIHIGDTRTGKWKDLPQPTRDQITKIFSPFLNRFGYS